MYFRQETYIQSPPDPGFPEKGFTEKRGIFLAGSESRSQFQCKMGLKHTLAIALILLALVASKKL